MFSQAALKGARIVARQSQFRSVSKRYASSSSGSGSSNLPLLLGGAGIVGLASYIYLDRNPSAKETASANLSNVKDKVEAAAGSAAGAGALIKDSWTPFKLQSIEPYNHNTKVYHFTFGEGNEGKTRGGDVANALLVRTPEGEGQVLDDKGKPVIRPYTPISANNQKGGLTLLVKEYKDGKLTPYIASMTPGRSELLFKGPIPKYTYNSNTFDRGLCISGGSGITPVYQLISHALDKPEDKTKWTLIFSNVTEEDILLRKEWDELAKNNPERLRINYVLDKPPRGWKGEKGFITPDMISKVFPKGNDKVMAFVCGPPPQVKSLAGPKDGPRQGELLGAFKDLGYTQEEVYKF